MLIMHNKLCVEGLKNISHSEREQKITELLKYHCEPAVLFWELTS